MKTRSIYHNINNRGNQVLGGGVRFWHSTFLKTLITSQPLGVRGHRLGNEPQPSGTVAFLVSVV